MRSPNGIDARSTGTSTDRLATWLVKRAAERAPPDLGERLAEEYQADLISQRQGFARLRFASGCYWASLRMSCDPLLCGTQRVAAAAGPSAPSVMTAHDDTFFSRRSMVFVAILAVHAA